jgi:hypothetical protein
LNIYGVNQLNDEELSLENLEERSLDEASNKETHLYPNWNI